MLGQDLTSQLSWSASEILVKRVCSVYLVEWLAIVFLVLLKWEVAANRVWSSRTKLCCHLQGSKMLVRGWRGGKVGRIMRWRVGKGRRVVRLECGRYLVLFNGGRERMSPRFFLFVSDVNQGAKECFSIPPRRDGKTLLSAVRDILGCESV